MTNQTPSKAREFALSVVRRLRQAGYEALWAGGCVRDKLLGRAPLDYDVATSATPDQVRRLFGRRQTVAVGAAFAEGCSELTGVGRLKYKESNRLEAIVTNLRKMGAEASCRDDVLIIEGGRDLKGAEINPFNDHRIAMSFAIAGLALKGQRILNENCVSKSYPDFWDDSVFGEFYKT